MINKKIRVVIVDDSAFMRTAIERMLHEDPSITIVGSASNGIEAIDKTLKTQPDVVTMDVEMPVMDGLQALKEIMRLRPTPVLMVSSLTNAGAKVTLDALDLGAVDYIPKPGSGFSADILNLKNELITKIHSAANSRPAHAKLDFSLGKHNSATNSSQIDKYIKRAVFIGASTGGPPAVQRIASNLDASLRAPVILAQHMPQTFTNAFALRLNSICSIRVKEAVNGEILQNSIMYVCPGDHQTTIKKINDGTYKFVIVPGTPNGEAFAPCINNLFNSGAKVFADKAIGVILTGMGQDGVEGLANIKNAGGITIAQDQATSVVFGMPKAAIDQKAAIYVASIEKIAKEIEIALKRP